MKKEDQIAQIKKLIERINIRLSANHASFFITMERHGEPILYHLYTATPDQIQRNCNERHIASGNFTHIHCCLVMMLEALKCIEL